MNKLRSFFLGEGLPFLFLFVFYLVFTIIYMLGGIEAKLEDNSYITWDAGWYLSINVHGYSWNPDHQSSVAFFPLFPFLWKLLCLNPMGIAVFNSILYAFTAMIFFRFFKLSILQKLFLMSIPCLMFCYLAYSEALFFLFTTIMLIGFRKEKNMLIFIGLLGAGLTRSALLAFVPGIIFILIMNFNGFERKHLKLGLIMLVPTFLSLILVLGFQYTYTHELFGAFQTQANWNHHLSFPSFPLHSFNSHIAFTEMFSLCIGLLCGTELLILLLNKLGLVKNRDLFNTKNEHLFSLSYIFCISIIILGIQNGTLSSINRYIMCVSFFWCAFDYFRQVDVRKILLAIVIMVLIFSGIFTMAGTFHSVKDYCRILGFLSLVMIPFLVRTESKTTTYLMAISIIGCFILQIHFYHLMLRWTWVG